MSFPITEYDSYEDKINQHEGTPLSEAGTIPAATPYTIELDELPEIDSLTISGYTEVTYLPTATNTFYIDYASATVYFHSTNAGENVTSVYTGEGSVLRASDVNDLQDAINLLQQEMYALMQSAIAPCRVTATSAVSTSVIIRKGVYFIKPKVPVTVALQTISFSAGAYVTTALTSGFSRVLALSLDADGNIVMYEGTEAATPAAASYTFTEAWGLLHTDELLIASIVVTDTGAAGAGTINTIAQSDITDLRGGGTPAAPVPSGTNYMFSDGWLKLRDVTLDEWHEVALDNGVLTIFATTTTTTAAPTTTTTTAEPTTTTTTGI